jgi:hypothetical protein
LQVNDGSEHAALAITINDHIFTTEKPVTFQAACERARQVATLRRSELIVLLISSMSRDTWGQRARTGQDDKGVGSIRKKRTANN